MPISFLNEMSDPTDVILPPSLPPIQQSLDSPARDGSAPVEGGGTTGNRNNAKRTRSEINSALNILHDELMASKIDDCKYIQTKLQNLLREAEQKISLLEKEERASGLNYSGRDAVECKCGNTFQSGGKYGADCSTCDYSHAKEQCVDCVKKCCSCNINTCKSCNNNGQGCSSCLEPLCKDCAAVCDQCGEKYCDRSRIRNCQMISVGDVYCCTLCMDRY